MAVSTPSFRNTIICDVVVFFENQTFDDLDYGICQNGVNTLKNSLNMENPLIYDIPSKTLIIPLKFRNLFGEYSLKSNTNFDIEIIVGLNSNFATKFTNYPNYSFPNYKRFVVLPLVPSGLSLEQLLSPNSPVSTDTKYFNLNENSGGQGYYDSIYIRSIGQYNGIEQYYSYTWITP